MTIWILEDHDAVLEEAAMWFRMLGTELTKQMNESRKEGEKLIFSTDRLFWLSGYRGRARPSPVRIAASKERLQRVAQGERLRQDSGEEERRSRLSKFAPKRWLRTVEEGAFDI